MDLYCCSGSAPCRTVMLVAKLIGVDLNKKDLNLDAGEHLKPEFLKLNPRHTVPTLVDNGFVMWESRAIVMYLADKYGKNDSLYPKDLQKRAIVNQRILFDAEIYNTFCSYWYPQLFEKAPADAGLLKKLNDFFDLLNTLLEGKAYIACDHLTIADIAFLTSLTSIEVTGIDIKKNSNIVKWLKTMEKEFPHWEENHQDNLEYKKWFQPFLKQ